MKMNWDKLIYIGAIDKVTVAENTDYRIRDSFGEVRRVLIREIMISTIDT